MALNPNAKQIPSLEIGRMDNATLLSFVLAVAAHAADDATVQAKLGSIYTYFATSATAYDVAYNPSQKDLLTDILSNLDDVRDKAATAWHTAALAALKSPNATKQQIAQQLVQLYKDYHLDASDEYMKQTLNIQQMIQAIEGNATIMAALPGMGLDDYLTDLKAKNEAFAAKMAERTAGTVGKTTGVVAAARADVEQKYRTFVRMSNVVSSYEGNGELDPFILVMTAEIEHYRQILSRKGVSTGTNSGGGSNDGGDTPSDGGDTPTPTPDPTPDNPTPDNPDTPDNPGGGSGGDDGGGGNVDPSGGGDL